MAAKDGELAVAAEGGAVYLLDAGGRLLRTEQFGATLDAVRIGGRSLVAQAGRTLEVRGGTTAKVFSLVPGVRLADAEGDRAVLVGAGKIRLLNLDTGADGVVASGTAPQLERGWLSYANGRRLSARRL